MGILPPIGVRCIQKLQSGAWSGRVWDVGTEYDAATLRQLWSRRNDKWIVVLMPWRANQRTAGAQGQKCLVSLSGPGRASQRRDFFEEGLQDEEESISDVKVPGGGAKCRGLWRIYIMKHAMRCHLCELTGTPKDTFVDITYSEGIDI